MPSPIAHATMGYVIYAVCRSRMPQQGLTRIGSVPRLLMVTVGLSLIPDLDAVLGILMSDLGRFHNNVMNSLVLGVVFALGVGGVVWVRQRFGFVQWFIIGLLCYDLHVIMDFFTIGRGVMAVWPFSWDRYQAPVSVFYGLHWSEGLVSTQHLWTVATELSFVAIVAMVIHLVSMNERSKRIPLAVSRSVEEKATQEGGASN